MISLPRFPRRSASFGGRLPCVSHRFHLRLSDFAPGFAHRAVSLPAGLPGFPSLALRFDTGPARILAR
jgi:hypothetical protein